MDHDAMGIHVQKLLAWKKDFEGAVDKFKAYVASIEGKDGASTDLTQRVDDLEAKIQTLYQATDKALTAVEQTEARVLPSEQVDALGFMLTWFQDNQQALEVLLSMGDDAPVGDAPIQEDDAVTIEKVGIIQKAPESPESADEPLPMDMNGNPPADAKTAPAGA